MQFKSLQQILRKNGARWVVGGNSGTYKDERFHKGERNNDYSAAGKTHYDKAPDRKVTATSMPQDQCIGSYLTSLAVNIRMETTVNDYKVLRMDFRLLGAT